MRILALHGFTGRGSDFAPLSQLCGGIWHCPDLPGHGSNPRLDCSPESTIDFINQRLLLPDSPRSTQTNILLGYSMGARAAMLQAIQHPSTWQALVLISPNPGIENEKERITRREADENLARSIEKNGVATFLDGWQETPLIRAQKDLPDDVRAAMQRSRLEHTTVGLANSLRQFGQGSITNLWPKLNKLAMPVCVITGEKDAKYSRIAERIQHKLGDNCQHFSIHNASHAPHLEEAQIFAPIITKFLAKFNKS